MAKQPFGNILALHNDVFQIAIIEPATHFPWHQSTTWLNATWSSHRG